jgi:hypothetical protein
MRRDRETSTPRSTKIAHTTLRKVVGQHTQDEALSETDVINVNPEDPRCGDPRAGLEVSELRRAEG